MREATAPPAGRVSRGWISKGYSQPRGPPAAAHAIISTARFMALTSPSLRRGRLYAGHPVDVEAARGGEGLTLATRSVWTQPLYAVGYELSMISTRPQDGQSNGRPAQNAEICIS